MKQKGNSDLVGKVVVVAIKAAREIPKTALVWALTHVVQPGDCIKLLVVVPAHSSSKKIFGISRFTSDCATGHWKSLSGTSSDQKQDIADSCSQMIFQLQDVYDPEKVKVRIKIVPGSPYGIVAAEAKKAQSNWVILDKRLKHEKKHCLEELQCNLVIMKRSQPKVLRLNLVGSPNMAPEVAWPSSFESEESPRHKKSKPEQLDEIRGPFVTPVSSPEHESSLTAASSISSSDPGASPFSLPGLYEGLKKEYSFITEESKNLFESDSDSDSEIDHPKTRSYFEPWMAEIHNSGTNSKHPGKGLQSVNDSSLTSKYSVLLEKFSTLNREPVNYRLDLKVSKSVREAISLSRHAPPGPPPLCSICQHKGPVFGHPPRWFTYAELEHATNGFSKSNFLAEGGFGSVHRGSLPDGQVIAVKQHKMASSQGDLEFCSEVEVLSCAQHRNVVMLIGFCIEDGKRLLVYEYICNGSLDSHLYGHNRNTLQWSARKKIAVGAARGLRYLHEECRVGCIVHRDMRPNNILVTHDFEPLVGDFGLARWQPDGDKGVETRIIGTFGYLAPEYAQSGQITDKADVYSFGVVLVELITGRKAMDINRPKGQQCLTEWARPLLESHAIKDLVDPRLGDCYAEQEVYGMLQCASLCIRRDPHLRPRMSQVLRMLEADFITNSAGGAAAAQTSLDVFAEKEATGFIHPTAVVHPNAVIGKGVSVGPFCTIGSSAKLGNECQLYPSSHIFGNTELGNHCILMTGAVVGDDLPGRTVIGCNNIIGHHAVVGIKCQDMKYRSGDECFLDVGDNNEIREYTSIHRSSMSSDRTVIGDNNLIMGSCHIAHDCKIGNSNIFANSTLLAGHVIVEDYAHTAGATVVHQFCHIGSFAFIGGGSVVSQDVPKYMMVSGERAELRGLNLEGLRRRGFQVIEIKSLRTAYRKIFMPSDTNSMGFDERLAEVEHNEDLSSVPAVRSMLQSIRDSFTENRRGICKFRQWSSS
ncbi:hypothetical protein COLO4_18220 [Corchorus olitorius]|uniref:Protein kinase domain-containing protein n=1 Tax=Corchorus olitorius TaxID=93759 RepID=A0A1R3JA04_9ROSI|nr:hypothetical protein COLO4_18220 [Corchorus olitorius]